MFNQPASGEWLKPAQMSGHLVLITAVHSIDRHFDSMRNEEVDRASFDLVDLDDSNPTARTMFDTHAGIVNKLKTGDTMILGRIDQVQTKSGNNAWVLAAYTVGADDVRAKAWVDAQGNGFTQPAATSAPPAATPPTPVGGTQLTPEQAALLAQLQGQQAS